LQFSVSCTTRVPREGEVNGRDYHFVSIPEFRERIARSDFLEYAEVHGNYYGTLKSEVRTRLEAGGDVLLDIDVQGAAQIREAAQEDQFWANATRSIFIGPPSLDLLQQRLRGRGTDDEQVVERRLLNARAEMRHWRHYDYLLINDDLDASMARLTAIVTAIRQRSAAVIPDDPWA
jgi:guanylate kinase